eukprot:g10984.t1
MGKRAAQSAAAQQAKVAKVEEKPVDPFVQELTPMLQHLEKAELTESSIEMLRSVAPFCLKAAQETNRRSRVATFGRMVELSWVEYGQSEICPIGFNGCIRRFVSFLLGNGGDACDPRSKGPRSMRDRCEEARHAFQQSMVDSIETTLKGIQAKHEGSVTEAENSLADLTAKQETTKQGKRNEVKERPSLCLLNFKVSSGATMRAIMRQEQQDLRLKEATEHAEQSRTEFESKAQTQTALEAETTQASEALKGAQDREEELAREKAATLKEQEAFEKFMVTFEAVKNGTFAGKEWRERNKAIDETLKVLAELCDASLKASLPTALRTKPAERGRFSLKAINFCEVALAGRGEKMKEKIGSFDAEAANRAQKSAEAKEAFDAIDAKLTGAKAETATAKEGRNGALPSSEQLDSLMKQKTGIEEEIKVGPGLRQKCQDRACENDIVVHILLVKS